MLQSHPTYVKAWSREPSQTQRTDSSNGLTSEGLKKWGWSHNVWYHWSCWDWALQSLFRCLIFPRCSPAQCCPYPNNQGVDDLYPPQLSLLFSLLLNPLCWCPGVAVMGVPEDDVQQIHPEHWTALVQEVRDFLAWNTTGLFCSYHGESVCPGCVQLICYKASCVPGVPLYAQCLFIPALNQSWVKSL